MPTVLLGLQLFKNSVNLYVISMIQPSRKIIYLDYQQLNLSSLGNLSKHIKLIDVTFIVFCYV